MDFSKRVRMVPHDDRRVKYIIERFIIAEKQTVIRQVMYRRSKFEIDSLIKVSKSILGNIKIYEYNNLSDMFIPTEDIRLNGICSPIAPLLPAWDAKFLLTYPYILWDNTNKIDIISEQSCAFNTRQELDLFLLNYDDGTIHNDVHPSDIRIFKQVCPYSPFVNIAPKVFQT